MSSIERVAAYIQVHTAQGIREHGEPAVPHVAELLEE